jgi:hypothetical protein
MFGCLLVGLLFYVIANVIHHPKLHSFSSFFLKQGLITVILFNCFNISFSAGIHWKYAKPTDSYYILSWMILVASAVLIAVSTTVMQLTNSIGYG